VIIRSARDFIASFYKKSFRHTAEAAHENAQNITDNFLVTVAILNG
jgi:hypothetical protein